MHVNNLKKGNTYKFFTKGFFNPKLISELEILDDYESGLPAKERDFF